MEDLMMPSLSKKRWFPAVALMLAVTFIGTDMGLRLGMSGGLAWAQEEKGSTRRLALFVVQKSRKDATAALILMGLLRTTGDRMLPAGIERALTSPVADPGALAVVIRQVEAGFKALNTGKWEEALKAYLDAEVNLARCRGIAERALVARVYKGLGLSFQNTGKPDQAKKSIHRSLVIYPNQKASEYAYNLESRKVFEKVLRGIQDAPNGSLDIQASVGAAEVYVDFEFRGFSPVRVSGLPAGEHLVTVYAEGRRLYSEFSTVKGGADDMIKPVLGAAVGGSEIAGSMDALERALRKGQSNGVPAARLAAATNATDVVFLLVSGSKAGFELDGVHWSVAKTTALKKTLARDATLVLAAQQMLADALGTPVPPEAEYGQLDSPPVALPGADTGSMAAVDGEDYVIDPDSPIFKDTGAKEEQFDLVKHWWFWTALGAVMAVGLGVGLGVGLSSGGDSGPANAGDLNITIAGPQYQ